MSAASAMKGNRTIRVRGKVCKRLVSMEYELGDGAAANVCELILVETPEEELCWVFVEEFHDNRMPEFKGKRIESVLELDDKDAAAVSWHLHAHGAKRWRKLAGDVLAKASAETVGQGKAKAKREFPWGVFGIAVFVAYALGAFVGTYS